MQFVKLDEFLDDDSNYTKIPNKILNVGLTPEAVILYTTVKSYEPEYLGNMETLCKHTSMTCEEVTSATRKLISHNMMTKDSVDDSNYIYKVVKSDKWIGL